jgi:hypothetical protein
MKQLQDNDGTDKHTRAIFYHTNRCQEGTDALFQTLLKEGQEKRATLKNAARLVEDKDEELSVLSSEVSATELEVERLVLDIASDLKKLDRKSPQLNAFKSVFSEKGGSDTIIRPEGESQLASLTSFMTRLNKFTDQPLIKETYAALEAGIKLFKEKLKSKRVEEERREQLFTEELLARKAIRQQLISAHGRLKDLFQADPDQAEAYFLSDPRAGSSVISNAEERGRVQAKAEYLLLLLDSKALAIDEDKKKEILASDTTLLDLWFGRTLGASTLEDIFIEEDPTLPLE